MFQVVTQIQEMTLTFIPKLLAIFLLFVLLGPWMLSVLVEFAATLFLNIPQYVR
ncbi:MAG: flagellar biosynthetic protein FliQ [Solimonas sp.]